MEDLLGMAHEQTTTSVRLVIPEDTSQWILASLLMLIHSTLKPLSFAPIKPYSVTSITFSSFLSYSGTMTHTVPVSLNPQTWAQGSPFTAQSLQPSLLPFFHISPFPSCRNILFILYYKKPST